MSVKKAATKVKSVGSKVSGVIYPLGVALPVAAPNINALMGGGPRGLLDFNVNALKTWRPPDWATVESYIDGPGGAALMTSISAAVAKWGIKALGLGGQTGALVMLINAVKAWGDGSAIGYGVQELVYPTVSGVGAPFGGVSAGGLFGGKGQPAKGSQQEMATKDDKPKVGLYWS
jgi:hypothetical protein